MGDALWVPIIAMILSIGGPVVLVIIVLMNRHRMAQQKYEKIHQALESGKSPEEVERMIEVMEKMKAKPPRRRTGYFRSGLVVIGLSLSSLVVGLIIGVNECLAAAGGGVLFGLALVAVWYVLDRNTKTA